MHSGLCQEVLTSVESVDCLVNHLVIFSSLDSIICISEEDQYTS